MSERKIVLAENPKFLQFVEQSFPVVKENVGDTSLKRVKVISCGKEPYLCYFFKVEVVKSCDGFITFIVVGEGKPEGKNDDGFIPDVWIMRTDDFNKAYDLKMKLTSLVHDFKPGGREMMHCYGSLQREKLMWE